MENIKEKIILLLNDINNEQYIQMIYGLTKSLYEEEKAD